MEPPGSDKKAQNDRPFERIRCFATPNFGKRALQQEQIALQGLGSVRNDGSFGSQTDRAFYSSHLQQGVDAMGGSLGDRYRKAEVSGARQADILLKAVA